MTSATASTSNSIVTTTSAPDTASAGSAATLAPSSASGRALSALRFQKNPAKVRSAAG
jgi:hypothetical protein